MTILGIQKEQMVGMAGGASVALILVAATATTVAIIAFGVIFAPGAFAFAAFLGSNALLIGSVTAAVAVITLPLALFLLNQASRWYREVNSTSLSQSAVIIPRSIVPSISSQGPSPTLPSSSQTPSIASVSIPVSATPTSSSMPIPSLAPNSSGSLISPFVPSSRSGLATATVALNQSEERHLLCASLFEQARSYIDAPGKLDGLPTADSGKTTVYLPRDLPIVIKASGSPKNRERFNKMVQAREICDESSYSHLVIPTARIHGNFIIESRLPIILEHEIKVQIGFYIDHVEEFTEAVEEFTGFLCQAKLDDITGGNNEAYSTLSTVPTGRYDNIALYLEGGVGKLGLIDLEGFEPISKREQREGYLAITAIEQAIRLFPHHLETIIQAAKKFEPNIERYRRALERERDCVLDYFKKAYHNHLDFVKQKNIDLIDPIKCVDIPQARKEKINEVIEVLIQKEHKEPFFQGCLGETPDVAIKLFNEVAFPEILDAIFKFITDGLKGNLEDRGGSTAISSYSKLISVRTLGFAPENEIYNDLIKLIASKLDMLTFRHKAKKDSFAREMTDALLRELESGREIAYYNPRFGIGGYAVRCIFC